MEQFLFYANGRYFKFSVFLMTLASVFYLWHQPTQPANGGTWLGYTLGTISALLIIWLMYFGRRKRDYHSNLGTVKGWLSAHVHLGTGLLLLATLHTGFQFGLNIHTLAYVLMCLAIFSGFYGAWTYVYLPRTKRENLKSLATEDYFLSVEDIDKQIIKLAKGLPKELLKVVNSAIERTTLGGSLRQQLSIKDRSCLYLNDALKPNPDQSLVISTLVDALSIASDQQRTSQLKQIIDLFVARKRMLITLRKDIKTAALLKVWLFCHIPVSFALLAALTAHILSVFIYW